MMVHVVLPLSACAAFAEAKSQRDEQQLDMDAEHHEGGSGAGSKVDNTAESGAPAPSAPLTASNPGAGTHMETADLRKSVHLMIEAAARVHGPRNAE
jgi:hypothetical protein